MQIIAPLQAAPKRKTFDEVVNPKVCLKPKRVEITNDCGIRGRTVWAGSVFEFDLASPEGHEDFLSLINCNKVKSVPITTPLFTAPTPPPPPPVEKVDWQAQNLARAFLEEFAKQATALPPRVKK